MFNQKLLEQALSVNEISIALEFNNFVDYDLPSFLLDNIRTFLTEALSAAIESFKR